MKVKNRLQSEAKTKDRQKEENKLIRPFVMILGCVLLSMGLAIGSRFVESHESGQVYAASETRGEDEDPGKLEGQELPTGIAAVVTGVSEASAAGTRINRIGTSCENVMVGQRISTVEGGISRLNISASMESTVNSLDQAVMEMAGSPKLMSDKDYDTLLRIVEAEAGCEDLKGRILVANVVMNRVRDERFPDTVTEVVWDQSFGVAQFSPTYDGSICRVTVAKETKEAVRQALEGTDYSQGALFFVQKEAADQSNVAWFDRDLKWLFKHGNHEFYTYPDGTDIQGEGDMMEKDEDSPDQQEDGVIQMVKKDTPAS